MKASEFITETQRGQPLDAQKKVSPGAAFTLDGVSDLYRASMMMSRSPASLDDMDAQSFVTNRPMIITYTDEEQDMVRAAFKKMGIGYSEMLPSNSEEPDGINTVSPHISFKGY